MKINANNVLKRKIKQVAFNTVNTEVIAKHLAAQLGLINTQEVYAVAKTLTVMVMVD